MAVFAHGVVDPAVAGRSKRNGEFAWSDLSCPFYSSVSSPVKCLGKECALFVDRKATFGSGHWFGCALKRIVVNLE